MFITKKLSFQKPIRSPRFTCCFIEIRTAKRPNQRYNNGTMVFFLALIIIFSDLIFERNVKSFYNFTVSRL